MLRSSHPLWNASEQNEDGYANFRQLAPKSVTIAMSLERSQIHDRIDHVHPSVLTLKFCENWSSTFGDKWSSSGPMKEKVTPAHLKGDMQLFFTKLTKSSFELLTAI